MKVEVQVIRDEKNLRFRFTGEILPAGLEQFGTVRVFGNNGKFREVTVLGVGYEKSGAMAATDYCRDEGYEVELKGFRF